jgi:hypothetical protein
LVEDSSSNNLVYSTGHSSYFSPYQVLTPGPKS